MKLGIAGLGHETITFWPGTTGLEAFRRDKPLGRDVVKRRRGTNTPIGGFVDSANQRASICSPSAQHSGA